MSSQQLYGVFVLGHHGLGPIEMVKLLLAQPYIFLRS